MEKLLFCLFIFDFFRILQKKVYIRRTIVFFMILCVEIIFLQLDKSNVYKIKNLMIFI